LEDNTMSDDQTTNTQGQGDAGAPAEVNPPHPRTPNQGPRTEDEARAAGESPSPLNNEGAQTQAHVDQLKDGEKVSDPAFNQPEHDSVNKDGMSDSGAPAEGTKPNQTNTGELAGAQAPQGENQPVADTPGTLEAEGKTEIQDEGDSSKQPESPANQPTAPAAPTPAGEGSTESDDDDSVPEGAPAPASTDPSVTADPNASTPATGAGTPDSNTQPSNQ
jgi:hypothetical protein